MKNRITASMLVRVVSIVGIVCLLALQWVWWKNAFRAVELDFLAKVDECVGSGVENAEIHLFDIKSKGIRIVNQAIGEKVNGNFKKISEHSATNTSEIKYIMDDALNRIHRPVTNEILQKYINIELQKKLDFIPSYTVKIHRDTAEVEGIQKPKWNRIAIGGKQDTIYQQFGFKSYVVLLVQSPNKYYIKQNKLIMLVSLGLVLLIGFILYFMYSNTKRDRKFAAFLVDYTRMITHDMRTPVTGLHMIFDMFQKDKDRLSRSNQRYLYDGMYMTKQMLLNLENILYVAKSEHNEMPVFRMLIDVRSFIENLVKIYRERRYDPKMVTIETHYEPENFTTNMDVTLMENILNNLLDNAIKYTPVETLIQIFCSKVGDEVTIRVRDNGMGISPEDQKRIFKLFEQGSSDFVRKKHAGYGIGLHYVQRAVKAMGGKVEVWSEQGVGTEFKITYTFSANSSEG